MHKWSKQWKEQIVNGDPYYRRREIGNKFGWTHKERKSISVNRASMIMDFLQAVWPDVEPVPIVAGSRHLQVYLRIYDWCVHELSIAVRIEPPKRWRCAVVRMQALMRRYMVSRHGPQMRLVLFRHRLIMRQAADFFSS